MELPPEMASLWYPALSLLSGMTLSMEDNLSWGGGSTREDGGITVSDAFFKFSTIVEDHFLLEK